MRREDEDKGRKDDGYEAFHEEDPVCIRTNASIGLRSALTNANLPDLRDHPDP